MQANCELFIGNAAALAFLHFLRQILPQHMGPSHFTENERGNIMLEVEASSEDISDFEDELEHKRSLVCNFFLAVSFLKRLTAIAKIP